MRRVTTGDIAEAADVSRTTVSFVLNGRDDKRVSEETRRHVWKVAREMGYVPSAASRTLRHGRNNVVVCILPQIAPTQPINAVKQSLSQTLWKSGLLTAYIDSPDRELPLADLWSPFDPAGVVIFDAVSDSDLALLRRAKIPFVDRLLTPESHRFGQQQVAVGRSQIAHLSHRGHRRVAYLGVSDPLERRFLEPRLAGAREAADNTDVHLSILDELPSDRDEAVRTLADLVARDGITALAAFNDEAAVRAYAAARGAGIRIPDDLSVIGTDDLEFAGFLDPPLTTIAFDYEASARALTESVVSQILGSEYDPVEEIVTFGIVERESVQVPPPGQAR